jgi:hypothetical protein
MCISAITCYKIGVCAFLPLLVTNYVHFCHYLLQILCISAITWYKLCAFLPLLVTNNVHFCHYLLQIMCISAITCYNLFVSIFLDATKNFPTVVLISLSILYIWILQSMNNFKHISEPLLITFYQILKLKFPEDFTGL